MISTSTRDALCSLILGSVSTLGFLIVLNLSFDEYRETTFVSFSRYGLWAIPPLALTTTYFSKTFKNAFAGRSLHQFGKFIVVGVSNTSIDLALLNILVFLIGFDGVMMFSTAKGSSFLVALINSYLWNKYWTFPNPSGQKNPTTYEFLRFLFVSLLALSINVLSASVSLSLLETYDLFAGGLAVNLSAVIAIAASVFCNFLGYKFLVF
jgi:putative flippase GtrA